MFYEEYESGDERITNESVFCLRGLNEFYCVCVILGYGQTVWDFSGFSLYFCSILIANAMLPHNDGFPVVMVGFIQFVRPSTHVLACKRTGVNDLEGTEHSSLQTSAL